jgi:hypothetical protein
MNWLGDKRENLFNYSHDDIIRINPSNFGSEYFKDKIRTYFLNHLGKKIDLRTIWFDNIFTVK